MVSSAATKAVQLTFLSKLITTASFRDDLATSKNNYIHQICQHYIQSLSTLLRVHFIKPSFINDKSIKCVRQLAARKNECDGFDILINGIREILQQDGHHRASINLCKEFKNRFVNKGTIGAQLVSKHVIIIRLLSYCSDNFLPHAVDRIFLQKLSK